MNKYANILFDGSFKTVVCAPQNEDLLIKIIELMIPGKHIAKLKPGDKENHGLSVSDKITTFDLYCTSNIGEQFIVEMQFSRQSHYADRMLTYATYPIRAQMTAKLNTRKEKQSKGESVDKMDYSLIPVYVISLLNFSIEHESGEALEEGLVSRYSIRNDHNGELMTEALQFIYLELGRLQVRRDEPQKCRTLLEKFAFSLCYIHELDERPSSFEDEMLKRLYNAAEFANMTIEQQTEYERIMRTELDIIAEKNYARETGLAEGRAEGLAEGLAEGEASMLAKVKAAISMLKEGSSVEIVSSKTGLSKTDIEALRL